MWRSWARCHNLTTKLHCMYNLFYSWLYTLYKDPSQEIGSQIIIILLFISGQASQMCLLWQLVFSFSGMVSDFMNTHIITHNVVLSVIACWQRAKSAVYEASEQISVWSTSNISRWWLFILFLSHTILSEYP